MIALHNLDEKTSQLYDLKIAEYAQPLLKPNLEVSQSHAMNGYLSELFLSEEIHQNPQAELNFDIRYTPKEQTDKIEKDISIYDDSVHYIAPLFMVHPQHFRSLALKLSLEEFIPSCRDMTMLLLSSVNRQNNRRILIRLAKDLIVGKMLTLIGISKFFNKLNQIYK